MIKSIFIDYFTSYSVFAPIIAIISATLLLIVIFVNIKLSYKHKQQFIPLTILAVCLAFLTYQYIPNHIISSAVQTGNIYEYKKAINYAILPYQKGVFYSLTGEAYYQFEKDGVKAVQCYEKAHQYTKDYIADGYIPAALLYNVKGDYDKAIEISLARKTYNILTISYILKKDYKKALKYANLCINLNKSNPWYYCTRAIICRNLGNIENADKDYRKSLDLCNNNSKFADRINKMYANYQYSFKNKYLNLAKEYKFIQ